MYLGKEERGPMDTSIRVHIYSVEVKQYLCKHSRKIYP